MEYERRISDGSSGGCSSDLGLCRNPARRASRNQEKRKEVVMNDKLELDIPVLLPDLPDAADACLDRLVSTLSKREGVERAHVICLDAIGRASCREGVGKYV